MSFQGPVDLLLGLDGNRAQPLYGQLERSLRDAIRDGRLAAGARLPSSRGLALELGISRGVVTAAYTQLAAEGYLESRQGAPVRVARGVRAQPQGPPPPPLTEHYTYDFTPGVPDLAAFPRARWLRALRRAWQEAPLDAIGRTDPRGVPELRRALADYLRRVRGAAADSEHLLVCTGFRQGLSLACRWMGASGLRQVALEDPGWHAHRLVIEEAGLDVVPIPVDDEGLDVPALAASGADAVVVTPAHQFPSGVVLSARRRAELIAWAEKGDRLIIEDEYDAELCHERVGTLQGLAPDRVLHVGSASKRLAPGLRLGWILAPSWLSWALISAKVVEDGGSEVIGQLTMADFIAAGELERHLRRMRLRYARRRDRLLSALSQGIPSWRPQPSAGGLYFVVHLPDGAHEASLLSAAARRGFGLEGVSLHSYTGDHRPGLVLGYGGIVDPAIDRAVSLLAQIQTESAAPTRRARQRSRR